MNKFLILLLTFSLSACVEHKPIVYNPDDFINPNRIVIKKAPVHMHRPTVDASFGVGNDPLVVSAYERFTQRGIAQSVRSKGFSVLPYSPHTHPIVTCAPLHLCVIQLEQKEQINNLSLGDSAHWLISTARVGTREQGSYQILIKPKLYNLATDLVIATSQRTYNIGLVSQKGAITHVVSFYYPQETLTKTLDAIHAQSMKSDPAMSVHPLSIRLNQLNFNYQLTGAKPVWRPTTVFDDGHKTFIRMPKVTAYRDLPVLYLLRDKQMQLVNYRYRTPFYVIDGLFKRAYLISGKGKYQVRVVINNRAFV